MIEQDYADFCSFAFDIRQQARKFFADKGDEYVHQLGDLVRSEIAACPNGKVEPAYDFLAAILAEEAQRRMS